MMNITSTVKYFQELLDKLPHSNSLRHRLCKSTDVNFEALPGLAKTEVKAKHVYKGHQKPQAESVTANKIIFLKLIALIPGNA